MMHKKRDLEVVQTYENIVIPLMCGSKVIHIRTDEEGRLDGICRSLISFNDELVVLHVHSDSETVSTPLTEDEEEDGD